MDVEHNETNPTITVHLSHEDCDIRKKRKKIYIVEYNSGNVYIH